MGLASSIGDRANAGMLPLRWAVVHKKEGAGQDSQDVETKVVGKARCTSSKKMNGKA